MMNFNSKFMDRMFRKVDNVKWDLMSGKLGYSTSEGIISIDLGELSEDKTEAPDAQVIINPFDDFGFQVPAFAQSIPVESVNIGDMIYSSKTTGWVVKKNNKSFKVMKCDGTRSDWVPPKVQMLGFDSGVMVLRSLVSMLPGGSNQLNNFNSMMLPMVMGGFMDEGTMENFMPMMLFSQMQGGDSSSMNPMFMAMMMSKMMGNGSNPFSSDKKNSYFNNK